MDKVDRRPAARPAVTATRSGPRPAGASSSRLLQGADVEHQTSGFPVAAMSGHRSAAIVVRPVPRRRQR
jgi:hypothetical protein